MYSSETVLVKWITCAGGTRIWENRMLLQGFVVNQSYRDMIYRKPPQI